MRLMISGPASPEAKRPGRMMHTSAGTMVSMLQDL